MKFTGERFIPGQTDPELQMEHFNRYQFARQFVKGKRVLDAACGAGYGSDILARDAEFVVGIDISEESIAYAKGEYGGKRTEFQIASVDNLPFEENSFDIVVSFETLEHVDGRTQQRFLHEISRVLTENGILIMSTPNHSVYSKRGVNEFHVKELTDTEFRYLLEAHFQCVHMLFSQQWEICDVIICDGQGTAALRNGLPLDQAEYMIAVCSNVEIDPVLSQVTVRTDKKLEQLMEWAIENHNTNEKNNVHILKLNEKVQQYEQELENKSGHIELLSQKYQALVALNEAQEAEWQRALRNKDRHIEQLLVADRELTQIKSSRSWRFMGYAWRIRDLIAPHGSKRRLLIKLVVKFVKHPIRFLGKLTPKRIGKFFRVLRREGTEGVSRRLDDCLIGTDIKAQAIEIFPVDVTVAKTKEDYAVIDIPQWEHPQVSIVIPVYNQFEYTYRCIRSVAGNSGEISFEIIVADDCSTDLTQELDQIIHGVVLIHNQENLRFLRNCNNAAKQARGQYILFLNNDTQVQQNWLAPLVELIERDPGIGMVGSKLVYPDGRLQEAGGIIWRDGSAWNYGNRSDPAFPEFNYVKEVDYISGASIMIRRTLWEEIGGFDERFAPAYCEDSDLAFTVRKMGYKVMYQPLSIVVHFEGVSNGTDLSNGQKAYQVINQKKFFEKWKDVLEREHFENAENVFLARDRSRHKKTILVIDHYIPTYDKDAGSRTMDQYLRLLVDMGYHVKLLGDNFYHNVPYATRYEQWGIEILYGSYYRENWKKWVKDNSSYIATVFLNRPHISIKYIDYFKSATNAKIVYSVSDLHSLRVSREYEITHDENLLKSAQEWKKTEFYIMKKADVVFTLSEDERGIINRELAEDKAVISPIFIYNTFPTEPFSPKDKYDIMFVGGFGHSPNVDGILWFVQEIWEKVQEKLPESRLVIIGSRPTERILELQSERILVTGYVTDEELENYYQHCRVCVIPLRYGAGVKGKTIEAMYHQVPIVSTSIGIEGLPDIDEYISCFDDADLFAKQVIHMYRDEESARKAAAGYIEYVKKHFSYESAKKLFNEIF